jgi:hypothetical protein
LGPPGQGTDVDASHGVWFWGGVGPGRRKVNVQRGGGGREEGRGQRKGRRERKKEMKNGKGQ